MIEKLTPFLIFGASLGSGLIAGLFFAFSAFVMKALYRLPPEQGISAMQSINSTVLNRLFLTVFMGTSLVCIILVILSLLNWQDPNAIYIFTGSLLYLLGSLLVTAVCNVPLNDALANVIATDPESLGQWKDYYSKWTAWNHVRTISSFIALALFVFVLWRM
ncbi:membrane protein [Bacillus sp. J14TS2]|uniref:anthrone oxygenase family protein n=1 Tax=Bacillus sp. J14TS2 TaxID=2807188 RepID=UPI001B15E1A3|nr:anthrone oxygenase family protein [Bacillus sp. J14TS2]GIN71655.1 membrane protein [Bacillus sp. J14TS2]